MGYCQCYDLVCLKKSLVLCVWCEKSSPGSGKVSELVSRIYFSLHSKNSHHFGLCTQVIRALAVQHSALLLAEGSSLNSGQGVLQDLVARVEIRCKPVILDLSFDCLVFHCSFTVLRGRLFYFSEFGHSAFQCLCYSFISAWTVLDPKVCEIRTSWLLLPVLRWWWLSLKW